ncbi:MAG: shikimate dehydrogenase [Porticoccaceae bacterium]|jgi:shikimate dehydrogenase|nr:shikimate dehydrogenase [Porticoccaceae bacterium]HLS97657.1 shikimate dehydrogenase [Porticoccaceae bacterium]
MTDRYAVFGNPVAHSRSPDIHARFAAATGQDLVYDRQLVALGGFASAARAFFTAGGKGLNVTLPFKEDAFSFADTLSPRARRAGAVNTLALRGEAVLGDNTDGAGLVRDIRANLGWELAGRRVLVLGAGGAVRGVLAPLLAEGPARLVIANRTLARAAELATAFADLGPVAGGGFAELDGQTFDLVINGTSASLAGDLPPLPEGLLAPGARCYDMMYGKAPTVFMAWAADRGAVVADGLGMLVEQAAEAFLLWRGVRPETAPVVAWLRAGLTSDA